VTVGFISVALLLHFAPTLQHRDDDGFSVYLTIATTVALAGLIQFLTQVIGWLSERGDRLEFHQFFGTRRSAIGVIPDLVSRHDLDPWYADGAQAARPKGITTVVPFEDLKAATSIAKLFESYGVQLELRKDSGTYDKGPPRRTFIAVGLGFNRLTCFLAERSGDLFQIQYTDAHTGESKDDFLIEHQPHPKPSRDTDYALVARVPFHFDGRQVTGFVCAGRLAAGTEAAGYYLKNDWRSMHDRYVKEGKDLHRHALALVISHSTNPVFKVPRVVKECFRKV
jgi:hypothetical protein